jgi:hypothetical protein
MRDLKRFTKVGLGLLAAGAVLLAGSVVLRRNIPDDYIGAQRYYLTELEELLAEFDTLATGRRIVLIGSSPVLIGLSAEQIETATGVPTRNLAMNASRAVFADYATMVFDHMRPGDVAIIVNPNLSRAPRLEIELRCVRDFTFDCFREQPGRLPRIVNDMLVLFTDRAFAYEVVPRTERGDTIFPEEPTLQTRPARFAGPFPENGAEDLAELAAEVRRRGGCPIIVLTPLLPAPEERALWQTEFDKLWGRIDQAGLTNIVVEDSPLWGDLALFHHHEHPSEPGRERWTESVIAKMQENGLPGGCGGV